MAAETFGHFLLNLTINKGHIDARQAEYHLEVKTKYLELKEHRPERHAIRNLLGMLLYLLGKIDEAFEYFDKVLSEGEDPENMNALANRKYICEKLFRFPESRVCEKKIDQLITHDTVDGEKRCKHRRARSLAEQAFAYSFDVFEESMTSERYRKSVDLYQQAIQLAGDLIPSDEMEDWKISLGMACHKIFNSIKFSEDISVREEAKSWFQKAINIFIQIIEANNDNNLVSDSWRHLGELFKQRDYGLDLVPNYFKNFIGHPETCFEKAMSASPENPRILARYAKHYTKHQPGEALRLVNQSIQLDNTMFNIHAYGTRATIYIEQYKKQLKQKKKGQIYNPLDETLLTKAEDDLKKTFEFYSTPMHLETMAEVLYYMATDSNGRVKQGCEGERKLQQTLTMCAKAAACQDGKKRASVHKVRGQSLCALDEHQAALRSFQRAVECESTSNIFIGCGNLLIFEYEHVLMSMTDVLSSNSPVIADMVYWLNRVAKIFLSTNWVMVPLRKLQKEHPGHWKKFVKYCEENDYMRELHDIQRAATWESQPQRYHLFSIKEGPIPPVLDQYQLSSDALEATTSKGDLPHDRSKNGQRTYDFFVIYSDSASEWVFRCLLEKLEETGLKGCIKDRDFKLGEMKLTNYSESIENSVCTIIVITKDFEENNMCSRAMHFALNNNNQLVIPVRLDDTDIPKPLRCQTFFDATDAVDWVRLQKDIEREIIKLDVI